LKHIPEDMWMADEARREGDAMTYDELMKEATKYREEAISHTDSGYDDLAARATPYALTSIICLLMARELRENSPAKKTCEGLGTL